ncbi:ParB N-terminal domain-containing protein [Altererythrobacter sp. KTW20L]|uniref:plasmid partitioning protein RepB C-terminal domain-containing protein n=1 Tax=Altererythrobacter sp. KTW20L TaxID=2942210 RepID=UPI0020BEF445|nr:plasmid partitioning protein RepB C-terminal domain-containing protein [Altererythrobacter sp. KTW20L]MCL6252308.1 ParB N-terminal domain-containing protein [Altererythrobacter sp. KTW20L]
MSWLGNTRVARAFEDTTLRIAISDIEPLHDVRSEVRKSVKYGQIAASIAEVGIIEPPVVVRDPNSPDRFRLLDGHSRLDILKANGAREVVCLVATEDEAFTYNRRVSRIAIIQEHRMILAAVKKGLSEERLARALNVNVALIKKKRNLLLGICPEVVELLRDRHVPLNGFAELRRLKPMRQIRAAELMVAMNRYSLGYIKSLVAGTPPDQLVEGKGKSARGLTNEQIDLMTEESERLDREFQLIEQGYGSDHLDLVLAAAYLGALLENARVVRHLAQHHADLLQEFQKIAEIRKAA